MPWGMKISVEKSFRKNSTMEPLGNKSGGPLAIRAVLLSNDTVLTCRAATAAEPGRTG